MNINIEEIVEEFDHLFCQCSVGTIPNTEEEYSLWDITRPEGDKNSDFKMLAEEMQDWLRTTLTSLQSHHEEAVRKAREEERENIVEWAKTHNMPDFTGNDERLNGYNDALIMLVTYVDFITSNQDRV